MRLLLACLVAAMIAAPGALAKEGVVAFLERPVPSDAPPGEKVELVWRLAYPREDGGWRPFSALGVFVQLLGSTGQTATEAVAAESPLGRFVAEVEIPAGGVDEIRIGLRGTTDLFFAVRPGYPSEQAIPYAAASRPSLAAIAAARLLRAVF